MICGRCLLEGSFIRLSRIRFLIRMNWKKTNTLEEKESKHAWNAQTSNQEKERMRTEARSRNSVRTCEGMSITCL